MLRQLLIGSAVGAGLLLIGVASSAEARGRAFGTGMGAVNPANQFASPWFYTPYGYPYYVTNPVYYGTWGYNSGAYWQPQYPVNPLISNPGFYSPGIYAPSLDFFGDE